MSKAQTLARLAKKLEEEEIVTLIVLHDVQPQGREADAIPDVLVGAVGGTPASMARAVAQWQRENPDGFVADPEDVEGSIRSFVRRCHGLDPDRPWSGQEIPDEARRARRRRQKPRGGAS